MIETTPSLYVVVTGPTTVGEASGGFVSMAGGFLSKGALDGEGLTTVVSGAGAGVFETAGTRPFAGCSTTGAFGFTCPPPFGAAFVGAGPSSGSVDVKVSVRYNAVRKASIGAIGAYTCFEQSNPGV